MIPYSLGGEFRPTEPFGFLDGSASSPAPETTSWQTPTGVTWSFATSSEEGSLWSTWTVSIIRDVDLFDESSLFEPEHESSTVRATYAYDGLGRRVKVDGVAGSNAWTVSIISGADVLFEKNNTGAVTKYVYANGMRLAKVNPDGSVHYVLSDHQGSTRKILDASRVEQYSVEYEPFGKPYATSGPKPDPHKYTMEKHDDPTGLVYLRARQYDPDVGRFVSADPVLGSLSRPQTLNRYAYVTNNPINRVNPSGMYECWSGAGDRLYQSCLRWKSWEDTLAAVDAWQKAHPEPWTWDTVMMLAGFVPGLGEISDAYFITQDLRACSEGRCDWGQLALDAGLAAIPFAAIGMARVVGRVLRGADEGVRGVLRSLPPGSGWKPFRAGDEGFGPIFQVGSKDGRLGSWWGVARAPSRDAALAMHGPLGRRADELRTAFVKPGATFYARPVLEREAHWNIGRQGFLYEIWVDATDVYLIGRIPLA